MSSSEPLKLSQILARTRYERFLHLRLIVRSSKRNDFNAFSHVKTSIKSESTELLSGNERHLTFEVLEFADLRSLMEHPHDLTPFRDSDVKVGMQNKV